MISVGVLCFIQSQLQAQPTATHRPLRSSRSVPPDYHADPTSTGATDTALLSARLPASKLAARRTQSIDEPMFQDAQGTSRQASAAVPTRYKTELCRPFEENGTCRYGGKCQFAHGKAELRSVVRHPKYKTDLCRTFHTTGLCPYGPRCHFIHNDDERRSSECSSEQVRQQLAAAQEIGRRSTSVQQRLEDRPRFLQRQYSEYRPRDELHQRGLAVVPGSARTGPGSELHRRASTVADAVIRNSIGYQRQLQTVLESDQYSGLNVSTATRSLGSVTDSSSASSVTDSPSPSPTAGLILPAVEDPVTPTAATFRQPPAVPAWGSVDDDRARAALLAELVARLGPQDVADLISSLRLSGNTANSTGGLLRREDDGRDVDATVPQWSPDTWTQYHHHQYQHYQQQQQHGPATGNVCW